MSSSPRSVSSFVLATTSMVVSASALSCGSRPELEAAPLVSSVAGAAISVGHVHGWPEATRHLRFDVGEHVSADIGDPRPTGLDVFWSIASTQPETGFFYSDAIRGTNETRVAHASTALRVTDIRDASTLDYTQESVGPVPVGGIVVIAHAPSRRYLAIVVDGIEPTDPFTAGAGPYARANVTWYLTPPDVTDFSSAR